MNFPSLIYGVFLLSVIGMYWALQQRTARLWILVVASVAFYASLQLQYVPFILAITLVNFWLGMALSAPLNWRIANEDWESAQQDWSQRKLYLLWIGISLNVLLLFGFKYIPFVLNTVGNLFGLSLAQTQALWINENLIVPLGISYFCFESIAYLVDVYRGAPPSDRFSEFAAYKLFFPKITSGPITRYHAIANQFKTLQFPNLETATEGLWLIALGAIKKLLIADRIAVYVNLSADSLARAGSGDIWLLTFAYGLQLYFDFSGYVDIARGSAMLLGLTLPLNFNFPYMATSIADFWRRWHMSLGDWLRNYLYFPLGGSRQGLWRTCLNLLIVMVIAGFWHGAAWGFIIWGTLHGIALAVHRLNAAWAEKYPVLKSFWSSVPGVAIAWLVTQFTVFGTWLFFRLPQWNQFSLAIQRLWGHSADVQFAQKVYMETLGFNRPQFTILLLGIMALMGLIYGIQRLLKLQLNWPVKLLLIPLCFFVAWILSPSETIPYIYFDF
jgi:alginate O-acetyltransferase complex protein AlgI